MNKRQSLTAVRKALNSKVDRNKLKAAADELQPPIDQLRTIERSLHGLPRPIDIDRYEQQFQAVHPGFRINLLKKAPNVTPAEITIAMMLRLEMEISIIANLLGIGESSVRKLRTSLRLKLGIPRGQKEQELLRTL